MKVDPQAKAEVGWSPSFDSRRAQLRVQNDMRMEIGARRVLELFHFVFFFAGSDVDCPALIKLNN